VKSDPYSSLLCRRPQIFTTIEYFFISNFLDTIADD